MGPFRLDLASVGVERFFAPRERREARFGLRLAWSPAVHVTSLASPKVKRAVDAGGVVLAGLPMAVTYGIGRTRWTQAEVRLAPVEGALAERLASLDLEALVRVRSGGQAVAFEDLSPGVLPAHRTAGPPGGPPGKGETRVTLTAFGPDPDHGGHLVADLTVALARGVPPDSVSVLLETPGEGARPLYDLSNRIAAADGTVRIKVRTPGAAGPVAGRTLRVVWYTKEQELTVPFTWTDVPLR